jgi:hypothetical protein
LLGLPAEMFAHVSLSARSLHEYQH